MVAVALLLTSVHALCMFAFAFAQYPESVSAVELLSIASEYKYEQVGSPRCDELFDLGGLVTYTPPDPAPREADGSIVFPVSSFTLEGVKCAADPGAEFNFGIPLSTGPVALVRESSPDPDAFDFVHYGKYDGSRITCAADDDGELPVNLTIQEFAVMSTIRDVEYVSGDPRDGIRTTLKGVWTLTLVLLVADSDAPDICIFSDGGVGAKLVEESSDNGSGTEVEEGERDVKASADSSKLGAGVIVGIVFAVLAAVAVFGALIAFFHLKSNAAIHRSGTSGSGSRGSELSA